MTARRGPGRAAAAGRGPRRVRVAPAPAAPTPRPSVSVVIPCHDYGRYLPGAIDSVLTQADVDVDVVVVDDASTDDSLALARDAARRDPRVQVLQHITNRGPVETFNDGLALARGEFVVRLDADDLLTPGSLARSTAVARAFPEVALVYGNPVHFRDDELPAVVRTSPSSWTVWRGADWVAARCRSGTNVITSPEVLMRRSVVDLVGGQRPLAHTHDMEMWLRVAAHGDVAHVDGADQALHRDHSASMSAREVTSMLVDLRGRRDAFDVFFAGPGGDRLDDAPSLHAAARAALARESLVRASHTYDRGRGDAAVTAAVLDLVHELDPTAVSSAAYRGLRRRMARGPHGSPAHPASVAAALWRRAAHEVDHRHWQRWGVFRAG